MPTPIKIIAGDLQLTAELNDSPTANAIRDALPIESRGQRWGEEIYCTIPVDCGIEEDARDILDIGEIAYWPPGRAFCIFFGPTPASAANEPRAASEVNIVGRIDSGAAQLTGAPTDTIIRIEKKPITPPPR